MIRNSHLDLVNAALRELGLDYTTTVLGGQMREALLEARAILPVNGIPDPLDAETAFVLKVARRMVVNAGAK